MIRFGLVTVFAAFGAGGCGGRTADPATVAAGYKTAGSADDAYGAKDYAKALKGYDEIIQAGGMQADVLAEIHLKRAVCRMEAGDVAGAEADMELAERGGAAGADYANARKRLTEKKGGR